MRGAGTRRRDDRGRSTGGDERGSAVADDDRAQSTIDFVVGIGVFFLTFSFVVLLVPELASPFAGAEEAVVADRAVDTLSGDLLATGTVGVLDGTCTEAFFAGSGTACGFDAARPTHELLGVEEGAQLNVTVERRAGTGGSATEVVCYDGAAVRDCASGGDALARGPAPPSTTQSVRVATRVVRLDGETLLLRLRTW